jgi:Fe2+ or Zn2+ uptake regulation protein
MINNILKGRKDHPTADMIYQTAREMEPTISLGTVYRNLKLLADEGIIITLETEEKRVHYDGDTSRHSHFICSKCGKQANVDTSICLTSYPAQYNYHCHHCENHGYVDCDEVFYDTKVAQFAPTPISVPIEAEGLSTSCLICGESVPAKTLYQPEFVICEKCKKAILKLRKMLEDKE